MLKHGHVRKIQLQSKQMRKASEIIELGEQETKWNWSGENLLMKKVFISYYEDFSINVMILRIS